MQIKVTKTKNNEQYYTKTSGATTVLICLLNKIKDGEYIENGTRVSCKDYIGDSIANQELGFPNGGSSPTHPIDKSRFCFSFVTHNKEATKLLIKQSKILNKLERDSGLPETKFYVESDNYVVIDADPFWNKSTLLTSTLIQIVRSLVYKTNKRTVYTHIKECINQHKQAKDFNYWINIIDSGIDFKFLFNNIDKILNGNPFTACNDLLIKDKVSKKAKVKGDPIYTYYFENIEVTTLDGVVRNVKYCKSYNHNFHGISNFCNNLIYLNRTSINNKFDEVVSAAFISWAYNYWLLKNKKV